MTQESTHEVVKSRPEVPSDLQEAVESLITARPDLADPEKLRLFSQALNRRIAHGNSQDGGPTTDEANAESAKAEVARAKRMTSFATIVAGTGSAAILTVCAVPNAPPWVFIVAGLLGFLATRYAAPRIDRFGERHAAHNRRPSV